MVKFAGIILAFAACSIIGLYKASELKLRKKLLMDFKELILRISTEMGYFKAPLPEIFARLSSVEDRETDILLRECLVAYGNENTDMAKLWTSAVEHVYKGTPVTTRDLNILKKCGEFLGQSDFKGQQEHFALLHHQLDLQIEDAEDAVRTKGRMYGKMGVSVGIVIAIVLF